MTFAAHWLADVLRAAGCTVVEQPGWKTRGRREMGQIKGVLAHHTASAIGSGNAPCIGIVTNGRPDLEGPLAHLVLGRDGTYFVIAAGRCNHAGAGLWQGINDANGQMIGIEAENAGTGKEPWPDVQMNAYIRGTAAILKHIGAEAIMAAGHKEYALPKGRKIDPTFDMDAFRSSVAAAMGGSFSDVRSVPPVQPARAMLRRGDTGEAVRTLQGKISVPIDGNFGPKTEAAVKSFQTANGLVADGLVGPATWKALGL